MRPLFRSRYQPERLLHDAMFGLGISAIALVLTFAATWVWGALHHEDGCPHWDAKRGWGHDDADHLCIRRKG